MTTSIHGSGRDQKRVPAKSGIVRVPFTDVRYHMFTA